MTLETIQTSLSPRSLRGKVNYHNGLAAESSVERHYAALGYPVVARRWRGQSGELDLVLKDGAGFLMVEVKSGPTHDKASEHFQARQMHRVFQTAIEFVAGQPLGLNTDMRVDLALVDQSGHVKVIENISMH